jgi:hypothetical protein
MVAIAAKTLPSLDAQLVGTSTQVCSSTAAHSVLYGFENERARLRKIPQSPNGFAHALSYDVFYQGTIQNVGDATVSTMLLSAAPGTCGPLTTRMLALREDVTLRAEDPAQPGTPTLLTASPVHGIYELPTLFASHAPRATPAQKDHPRAITVTAASRSQA